VVLHQNGELGEYLGSGPADIVLQRVTMELGGLVMLDDANVTFSYGRRYGLVGRNGIGKTTLLKHLAAKVHPHL
jgi:ATP-binding cassette, subfamily F, member 3